MGLKYYVCAMFLMVYGAGHCFQSSGTSKTRNTLLTFDESAEKWNGNLNSAEVNISCLTIYSTVCYISCCYVRNLLVNQHSIHCINNDNDIFRD